MKGEAIKNALIILLVGWLIKTILTDFRFVPEITEPEFSSTTGQNLLILFFGKTEVLPIPLMV